jgi:hypothetical protein
VALLQAAEPAAAIIGLRVHRVAAVAIITRQFPPAVVGTTTLQAVAVAIIIPPVLPAADGTGLPAVLPAVITESFLSP